MTGMGFAAILLAVFGFAGGFLALSGKAALSAGEYLALACVLWMEGADLYLLHLFLNLKFSKSISLCVGTSELVVSALFLTGLGEGRWQRKWSAISRIYDEKPDDWRGSLGSVVVRDSPVVSFL